MAVGFNMRRRYVDDTILAIGGGGAQIAKTDDGETWTIQDTATDFGLVQENSFTSGKGKYVVLSKEYNLPFYSNDGITWSGAAVANKEGTFRTLTFYNGYFVAASSALTDRYENPRETYKRWILYRSADGAVWEKFSDSFYDLVFPYEFVITDDGKLLLLGNGDYYAASGSNYQMVYTKIISTTVDSSSFYSKFLGTSSSIVAYYKGYFYRNYVNFLTYSTKPETYEGVMLGDYKINNSPSTSGVEILGGNNRVLFFISDSGYLCAFEFSPETKSFVRKMYVDEGERIEGRGIYANGKFIVATTHSLAYLRDNETVFNLSLKTNLLYYWRGFAVEK